MMISIDFECSNQHRFEGCFEDYEAYLHQLNTKMISCPVCDSNDIKRLYTGCSIQTRHSDSSTNRQNPALFEFMKTFNTFVKENFENVGRDFASVVRAIHYGQTDERGIYGETTAGEFRELQDEGISTVPLIDIEKIEN
jgi:hypothetical protein